MTNGIVEHMTSEDHLSGDDFLIGIIGDEFSCVENANHATTSPDGEQQDRSDPDMNASWTFVLEIKAAQLTTFFPMQHAKMIINNVQEMDVPAVESAVERAFQQDAGPMLECMDEETKKDTRSIFTESLILRNKACYRRQHVLETLA